MPVVEPDTHPPTRNPWNPAHTSGGSSGGAGAAVAAGFIPLSPGSDGAGSVRIPASASGLVGLKPTRNFVPNPHAPFDPFGMTVIGPLARSVSDAAALLDALLDLDPRRPTSHFARVEQTPPRLRIGLITTPPIGQCDPEPVATVEAAARALEGRGHRIIPLAGQRATIEEFLPIYQRMIVRSPVLLPGRLQPVTAWFRESARRTTDEAARQAIVTLTERARVAVEGTDLVLTPTIPILPPRIGAFNRQGGEATFLAASIMGSFTAAANITGGPAATVPFGLSEEGLPIGVQILGRPGDDVLVLRLARELEAARRGDFGLAPTGD